MFTLFGSDYVGSPGNCLYPHRFEVSDADSLKEAVRHDYVCAEYKNSYRNGANYLSADCLPVDCDNDHSDDPALWVTPEDVAANFPGVRFAVHYSRHHMKEKNGAAARPKFHVLFPIDPITDADAELVGVFYELIEKTEIADGVIYFQLTRGTSPRSYLPPKINLPHLSVVIRDVPIHTDWQENGIRAALVEDIRWLRCDIASLNLLGSVLAAEEARKKNAQKALFFRKEKKTVTEGEDANFFVVKDEVLWTHPANEMILSGVTRSIIKEKLAPSLGITVVEKTLTPDFVKSTSEAFFTNTADEIVPVTMLDRDPIADGAPGEITRKLLAAYKEYVKEELAKPLEDLLRD